MLAQWRGHTHNEARVSFVCFPQSVGTPQSNSRELAEQRVLGDSRLRRLEPGPLGSG